jgi:hypothetical protein
MSDRQDNQFAQVERPQLSVQEAAAPVAPVEAVEVVPLAEVLRQVRRDSRREPQQYLDETIVPFGGE